MTKLDFHSTSPAPGLETPAGACTGPGVTLDAEGPGRLPLRPRNARSTRSRLFARTLLWGVTLLWGLAFAAPKSGGQQATVQGASAQQPAPAATFPQSAGGSQGSPQQTGEQAPADKALPSAPSAVLSAKDEQLGRPAGSGMVFTAPSTVAGPGGATIELPRQGPLRVSLDDAISLGLQRNIRLRYDRGNERAVRGYTLNIFAALIPNLRVTGQANAQEFNLAAMGFKPSLISSFAGLLPAGYTFSTIVKVNTAQAQISADQAIFNLTDLELYRGAKYETAVVELNTLTDRGDVVLSVAGAYLQELADQANVTNAQAQERSAKTLFDQADAKHQAGVGTNLDALRAQVEYQQREQDTIAAQAQQAKDNIQLNRIMGLPAGQQLELTDAAPFAQVADMDLDTAKQTAYRHRKDLLSLEQQIELEIREQRAVKYQRLPTLAFNGYYGVLGEIGSFYHGVFNIEGTLSVPIFREAGQRGEEQLIDSQLVALHQRESDLREAIDGQIRSSMLDVQAATQLVQVAQSNVNLAEQELSDARERFAAGVDDNLPVVDAQATVASAQANLVQTLYRFNVAKLQLARNTGVVETRYRTYLGK